MQFHELSLPTTDIRASVEFYERLGFSQAETGDVWPYPYGVLTDGRIVIGLHQQPAGEPRERAARELRPTAARDSATGDPAITYVRPDVAHFASDLERRGYRLDYSRTGADEFHEIGLRDPAGQLISVLEARTYSPPGRDALEPSLCGEFAALALPAPAAIPEPADLEVAKRFWEPLGFVAAGEREDPFEHLALTSDGLDLLVHRLRGLPGPTLVFAEPGMARRIAHLREAGIELARRLPGGFAAAGVDPAASAMIAAPEGTRLLLLSAEL